MFKAKTETALHSSEKLVPEPPVQRLFLCNDPPADIERIVILKAIDLAQYRILGADGRMRHASGDAKLMNWLKAQKSELVEFIRLHQLLLSPIRQLPTEIFMQIFSMASHHRTTASNVGSRDRWSISHVCRKWRSIALSMHSLWSWIYIDLNRRRRASSAYLTFLNILLERSGNQPLYIDIVCDVITTPAMSNDHILPAIRSLSRHSPRWTELSIQASSTHHMMSSLNKMPTSLPALEMLNLTVWHHESRRDNFVYLSSSFVDCPCLCQLSIHGISLILAGIPFSQLTHFSGDFNAIALIKSLFMHSRHLTNLSFTIRETTTFDTHMIPNMTLPHLHHLSVFFQLIRHEQQAILAEALFSKLTLPSLKEITMTNIPGELIPNLTTLLTRSSSSSIHKLTIVSTSLQSGHLIELFELTPDLRMLDISLPPFRDLCHLILDRKASLPLPFLRAMRLHVENLNGIRHDIGLIQILRSLSSSRCELSQGVIPMEHFVLEFPSEDACHIAGAIMDSRPKNSLSYQSAEMLESYRVALELEIPGFLGIANTRSRVMDHLNPSRKTRRINDLFSKIEEEAEKLQVKRLWQFYLSRIHRTLYRIIHMPDTSLPNGMAQDVRERARKVLKLLSSNILIEDIRGRKWGFESPSSLVYIPAHDPRRRSSYGLKLLFGLQESSEAIDAIFRDA